MSKMEVISEESSVSDDDGVREILTAARRLPPAPPSIGGSSSSSRSRTTSGIMIHPAPPSNSNSESSDTGSRRSVALSSRSGRSKRSRGDWDEDASEEEEMTEESRRRLDYDRRTVCPIPSYRSSGFLSYDTLVLGRIIAPLQPDSSVDTTYCNSRLLQELMDVKYDIKDCRSRFYELRTKLNTFHDIGDKQMFINSDAVKMANIDALMRFQLSNPTDGQGNNLVLPDEVLYFADLCDGPGGFAEYFLWKKKWFCHGFGFTSKRMDWDLPVKPHYSAESFEAHYGSFSKKGQGDIYDPREVDKFMFYINKSTDQRGVHVVLANGGDNSNGDEDLKELNCRYMIMSEFMIALKILREGGHLVIRLFDMFTHFTVGLVYLMYRTFDSIHIHRPDTAMTASSERYILCKGRKQRKHVQDVYNYLLDSLTVYKNSNSRFTGNDDDKADILQLVPLRVINNANYFFDYVHENNEHHGRLQLKEIHDLIMLLKQPQYRLDEFVEKRKSYIWKKATTMWGIPTEFKHRSEKYTTASSTEIRAGKLVRPYPANILTQIERDGESLLTYNTMEDELVQPKDWNFVPVGRSRGFFMGLGGCDTYRFEGNGNWKKFPKIEMCNNTLVYADVVEETIIYEDKQVVTTSLHIIDAIILGGRDVRSLPYTERAEFAKKFALAMDKPNRDDLWTIRAKTPRPVTEIHRCLNMVKNQMLKRGSGDAPTQQPILSVDDKFVSPRYQEIKIFKPNGLAFFRTKKGNGVEGDFLYCLQNRLFWRWDETVNLDMAMKDYEDDERDKVGPIHAPIIINHLKEEIRKSKN